MKTNDNIHLKVKMLCKSASRAPTSFLRQKGSILRPNSNNNVTCTWQETMVRVQILIVIGED